LFVALVCGTFFLSFHTQSNTSGTNSSIATQTIDVSAPEQSRPLLTLRELFENEWPQLPSFYGTMSFNGQRLKIGWRLNGDFVARSKFLLLYIDSSIPIDITLRACDYFATNYGKLIDSVDTVVNVWGKAPDDTSPTRLKDMVFSKRVFVYYENSEISLIDKGAIEEVFSRQGLSIELRDHAYAWAHRNDDYLPVASPLVVETLILPEPHTIPGGLVIHFDNLRQGLLTVVTRGKSLVILPKDPQ